MLALRHKYLPFFMWLFPLLFFAYQFILRLWPGLMIDQIMEQFSIDASHFGLLAAFYNGLKNLDRKYGGFVSQ